MSLAALLMGRGTFIVGVEDQEDGTTRVYLKSRGDNIYFVSPENLPEVRRAWGYQGHVTVDVDELPIYCIPCETCRGFAFVRGEDDHEFLERTQPCPWGCTPENV